MEDREFLQLGLVEAEQMVIVKAPVKTLRLLVDLLCPPLPLRVEKQFAIF